MEKWQVESVFGVPFEKKMVLPSVEREKFHGYRSGLRRNKKQNSVKPVLQRIGTFLIRFL
ncbi:MAG: hypothetical protein ABFS19_12500 [Thermodesulfobacteriota bacterium]